MTTQNARYQHAQRDTELLAVNNLKKRELRWAGDTRRTVGKLQNDVIAYEGGYSRRYLERQDSLTAAITAFGSSSVEVQVSKSISLTADTTFPITAAVEVLKGGSFTLNGFTLRFQGPFRGVDAYIFVGAGSVIFETPGETLVNWFYAGTDYGAAVTKAFACREDRGNRVIDGPAVSKYFSTTITLANNHVHWFGYAASPNDDTAPRYIWNGAEDSTMFTSTVGVVDFQLFDIVLDGAHITKWGLVCDLVRKSGFHNLVVQRTVGFWNFTNCYYTDFLRIAARLQTPGKYTGAGKVSVANWIEICNNGFLAPCTWQSNANNSRIEHFTMSQCGAYEYPGSGGATNITQLVLISGQNIAFTLPTLESIESNQIPTGAEDGDKFGYHTGMVGDQASQLSSPVLVGVSAANTTAHALYLALTNSGTTRTLNIYKTQAAATANLGLADTTNLIGRGTRVGDGVITIHEQNGSGFHGQWTVAYTVDDKSLVYYANYNQTTNVIKVGGGGPIDIDNVYVEAVFVTHLLSVATKTRGGMSIGKIYMEDCHFYGAIIDSGSLKDVSIGDIVGIGCTFTGLYISDNSATTRIRIGSAEFHNRFVSSGGVNYSEEMRGFPGLAATPGYLPVIYQPTVLSGLVVSQGTDTADLIASYIQVTPGAIRDGLGRAVIVGRIEESNSLSTFVGWRFRPAAVVATYNVCVDVIGCVFIESQAALKESAANQGKIVLATFTTDITGAITALTDVFTATGVSPVCVCGILFPTTGGLTVPTVLNSVGDLVMKSTDEARLIRNDTADAADNKRLIIAGGGSSGSTRGGQVTVAGNEHATIPGKVQLSAGNVAGATIEFLATGTVYHYMDNTGHLIHGSRVQGKKGADVVAANDLSLGLQDNGGNLYKVTGNTQINGIATASWQVGSRVVLWFTGTPTIKHNTAPSAGFVAFLLQGSADLVAANNTFLEVIYDGTNWQELKRKTA